MRRKQNEEKIYEAALKVFSKYGYKKATLEAIGDKLNMTNANLYGYAASKQALYHDSVVYALNKWQNYVYDNTKDIDDPVQKLEKLCDTAVYYLADNKTFLRILKADPDIFPLFPTVDPYEEINRRSFTMIIEVLKEGVEKGCFNEINIEKSAQIIFSVYKNLILEGYIHSETSDVEELYQVTKQLFVNGIIK